MTAPDRLFRYRESSLARGGTSSVVGHCNPARFRRGLLSGSRARSRRVARKRSKRLAAALRAKTHFRWNGGATRSNFGLFRGLSVPLTPACASSTPASDRPHLGVISRVVLTAPFIGANSGYVAYHGGPMCSIGARDCDQNGPADEPDAHEDD